MNAKLFFILNLAAYMGIGACNGTNMNEMDEKKPKEIKEKPSDVKREKDLREIFINKFNSKLENRFKVKLPDTYKKFLNENAPNILEDKSFEPYTFFSFLTPNKESDIAGMVDERFQSYLETKDDILIRISDNIVNGMITIGGKKINVDNIFCIATCNRLEKEDIEQKNKKGESETKTIEKYENDYYFLDLKDDFSSKKNVHVYKVNYKAKDITRFESIEKFLEQCKSDAILRYKSLES